MIIPPPKILLIGTGEFTVNLVESCKTLGAETFQFEPASNLSPQEQAQALRQLLETSPPTAIIVGLIPIAAEFLEVLAQTSIRLIPSLAALQVTRSQEQMRKLAVEVLDLPTSRYAFAHNLNELQMKIAMGIGYPCVIKTLNCTENKPQITVKNAVELKKAWQLITQDQVVDLGVIVESIIDANLEFTLLTILSVDAHGQPDLRFCEPIGHVYRDGQYKGSWQPQRMSPNALQAAQHIARKIVIHLGGPGIFAIDLLAKGDRLWFTQALPHAFEVGFLTLLSQQQSIFEIYARLALGMPISVNLKSPAASLNFGTESKSNVGELTGSEQHLIKVFQNSHCSPKLQKGLAIAAGPDTQTAFAEAQKLITG